MIYIISTTLTLVKLLQNSKVLNKYIFILGQSSGVDVESILFWVLFILLLCCSVSIFDWLRRLVILYDDTFFPSYIQWG